jgi:hypothetical protein
MRTLLLVILMLSGGLLSAQNNTSSTVKPNGVVVFKNVNILPMINEEEVLVDQHVIIKDDKILTIGPSYEVEIPKGALEIDGRRKFLIPGFTDVQARVPRADRDGAEEHVLQTLYLYVANGITSIRSTTGSDYHLKLKERSQKGEIIAPRIFVSSPSLNGNTVRSFEEVRSKVSKYKLDGYDFLKIHPGLKLDIFNEVVRVANRVKIPLSGHVPSKVGIDRVLESESYASIEYMDGYIRGIVPENLNVNADSAGFFDFNFTNLADISNITDLAATTVSKRVWVIPCQSLIEKWLSPKSASAFSYDPEMRYVSQGLINQWTASKDRIRQDENYDAFRYADYISLRQKILRSLDRTGVNILLGSGSPQVFNVPGFSIHEELKAMANSGLNTYSILKSGTTNPALWLNQEDNFGTVKEGMTADLVLLNANPMDDVTYAQLMEGVMLRGMWIPKSTIDQELNKIASKVKK